MKKRIDYLKNFGFADEVTIVGPGINAKMNEFQAALGLLQLKYYRVARQKRKQVVNYYKELLNPIEGITFLEEINNVENNYSYFPILIARKKFGKSRDKVYNYLKENHIFTRRYFYPLISNFPAYRNLPSADKYNLPVANKIAEEVLCLPIYDALEKQQVDYIFKIILDSGK